MKAVILSLALAASSSAPSDFVTRPPVDYLGGAPVSFNEIVVPSRLIDAACRSQGSRSSPTMVVVGCYLPALNTVILPNPCDFPDEVYAQIKCHEVAHIRGWRHGIE